MTKKPSRKIYWFVEPKNSYTNKVIAQHLLATSQLSLEPQELLGVDDQAHLVFEVSEYAFISRLYKDRFNLNLEFCVFSRQGKNGRLRPWIFGDKKKG